ncbi:MAG TPA: protein kinase [Bryobacteraceae bacterium]|nr:protein kinase [Bryobacteraceae bacterium]
MAEEDSTETAFPAQTAALPRAGKYRVVGRIGQGGMGIVYRAIDDDLGRTVALKFIPPQLDVDSGAAQRFLREARAASALDHLNIGTIFGIEETDDHRRFIVMAYYEGQNLGQRMADHARPLAPAEAIAIAIQVARGLAEAHGRAIVHRDIKPSNILLTQQGVVKIVDFGLAAMPGAEILTTTGRTMGTPAYMSPEQAAGKPLDGRTDIWSLGIVLLEMLTGERVFQAETMAGILSQVVRGKITALDRLQPPFRSVVAKSLERNPEKRYRSAAEFLAALEAAAPETIAVRQAPPSAWRTWRLALGALLLSALLGGAGWYWRNTRHQVFPGAPGSAGVFDQYQKGLELMRRWDREGNLDRAITLFTEATKSNPGFALGFARLAEAYRLRYALSRDPAYLDTATRNAEEAMRLNPDLAAVQVVWGRIQSLKGKNDLATASIERAIAIDPNDADAQLAIARQYERLGRQADAEAAFQKAKALDPDGIAPHDFYANWLLRQGRTADAIREWQTVIRIAPDDAAAWVNLGTAFSDSGRTAESVTAYERALQYKPTDMGYNNLGNAYVRSGRYAEAVDAYRKAIALSGRNYLFHGNLAEAYTRIKGYEGQAKPAFEHAIELAEEERKRNPRDSAVLRDLASYYADTGNPALAQERIATALLLSPQSPDIEANAAEVYELLGQREKALGFAKQALEHGFPRQRLQQNPALAGLLSALQ